MDFAKHDCSVYWVLPERDCVTFGYLLSQIRLSSVVCLSSVCNVSAPYSAGENFRKCFYTILYSSHPLTSVHNFSEIVLGEPLRRGLNARGASSDVKHVEGYISEMVQDTASRIIND